MRFSDISLTKRILLSAAVPGLFAGWLAVEKVLDSYRSYSQASHLVTISNEISNIGDVIHTLQKERGATAGVLSSTDGSGAEAVAKQRQELDARLARWLSVASGGDPAQGDAQLSSLSALRVAVDQRRLTAAESRLRYSEIIEGLLKTSQHLAEQGEGSALSGPIDAYSRLSLAKEFTGRLRALGNSMISSGKAEATAIIEFARLYGAQSALIEEFARGGPAPVVEGKGLDLVESGALAATLHGLLVAGADGDLTGYQAADWYRLATERIDSLRELEKNSLQFIRDEAEKAAREEFRLLMLMAGALAAVFVTSIALSIAISLGVVRPVRRLTAAIERLASGETHEGSVASDARDEVGAMSRAVAGAIDEAKRQAELQRQDDFNRAEERRALAEATEMERAARSQALEQALGALDTGLAALSAGDLRFRIRQPLDGDFDTLRLAFDRSIEALETLVSLVGENANVIDEGCSELRVAADDLAQRTSGQAAALEQAAAALEEVASAVKTSSAGADEAQRSADEANRTSAEAARIVVETVTAMNEIARSSDRIGHIITVIDEIAFQTNLLALNAGVEAARAGEAGRGFAVVAQEVRELAQRSASAAKEIKSLVALASNDVAKGVVLVGRTGEALTGIERQVETVNRQVLAIARSAKEQSAALAEITATVCQLDQITQQNASMVEQTTAASATLAVEAGKLRLQLGTFRTGEDDDASDLFARQVA